MFEIKVGEIFDVLQLSIDVFKPIVLIAATDGDKMRDITIEATTRLKQALTNEREARLRAQEDVENIKVLNQLLNFMVLYNLGVLFKLL